MMCDGLDCLLDGFDGFGLDYNDAVTVSLTYHTNISSKIPTACL